MLYIFQNLKQLFGNERALLKAREEQLKMQLAEVIVSLFLEFFSQFS